MALGFDAISDAAISGDAGSLPSGPAPFAQADWPNPASRKQAGSIDIGQALLLTTLAVVASVSVLRTPLIVPQPKARYTTQEQAPNLLTSTLVPGTAPFAQFDWPTPLRVRPALSADSLSGLATRAIVSPPPVLPVDTGTPVTRRAQRFDDPPNVTIGFSSAPFYQTDFVTPLRARWAPQTDNLSGVTTRGIPPQLVASTAEWVTPARARGIPSADIPPNVLILIPTVTVLPFSNTDWPIVRRFDATGAQSLDVATYQPVTIVVAPFTPLEFPNPLRAKALTQDFAQSGTTTRGIPAPPPFFALDYPNPAGRKPQRFDDAPNLLATTLRPLATVPFMGADLPNPQTRKFTGTLETPPNTTVRGIPQPFPFSLTEWVTPRRAVHLSLDVPPNVALNAPLVATLPFRQSDQPLPPSRAKAIPYAEIGPYRQIVPPPPLFQSEWPTPGRVRQSQQDIALNWLISRQAKPFAQLDWMTPTRKSGLTVEQLVNPLVPGAAKPAPFHQAEWPISLRGPWLQHETERNWLLNNNLPILVSHQIRYLVAAPYETRLLTTQPEQRLIVAPYEQRIITGGLGMQTGPLPYAEYFMRVGDKTVFGIDWAGRLSNRWQAGELVALAYAVRPSEANGYQYVCTTAGQSASEEPIWPTAIGSTVGDGSVVWTCEPIDTTSLATTVLTTTWTTTAPMTVSQSVLVGQVASILVDATNAVAGVDYLVNCLAALVDTEGKVGQMKMKVR